MDLNNITMQQQHPVRVNSIRQTYATKKGTKSSHTMEELSSVCSLFAIKSNSEF